MRFALHGRILPRFSRWVMVVLACLAHGSARGQVAISATAVTNRAEADIQACKGQLNRIFEALQRYQAQHKRLPNWFRDLHPEYIAELKTFICPAVQREADLRSWREGIRTDVFFDPDLPTSYTYEFSVQVLQLVPGVKTTWQEYKQRQRSVVGDHVPIVRCFAHGPEKILNLALDGEVYPSRRYWEDEYSHLASHEDLNPERVFRDRLTAFLQQPRSFPLRNAAASRRLLDLSGHYNLGLNETCRFGSAGEADFGALPQGVVCLEKVGLEFDIRGRIQVQGKRMRLPFPERVGGIQIQQTCRRLHFLGGTAYGAKLDSEIGRFEVRYVDGQFRSIPILYGKDVLDWSWDPQTPPSAQRPGMALIAWQDDGLGTSSSGPTRARRLYHLAWDNPLPEVTIATLDFISALTDSAPFLVAISLE